MPVLPSPLNTINIMHGFNWNDLKYFLAIRRTGKLTVAAHQLGVDHTTVSRRIAALEEQLKATLFERSPQGYRPTPLGERLLSFAEAMETEALQAQSALMDTDLELSGSVRIGAPDGFGSYFLAPRLPELCRLYPDLEIDLVAMPRVFSLSKREADIAISLAQPKSGRLRSRKLTDYNLGLFASQDYLDRRGTPASSSDLHSHRLIGYIEDLLFAPELDYIPVIEKDLNTQLSSTNLIAQMNATKAGAGICVMPYFLSRSEPDLVPVLSDQVCIKRSFWLITHADSHPIQRIRTVADFIADQVVSNRVVFTEMVPRV